MWMMHYMVLKCIFDSQNFTKNERDVLDDGIKDWENRLDLDKDDAWEILRIKNALEADERGHWNRAKEFIKERKLNYNKWYKAGIPFIADPYKCRTFGKL